MGKNDLQKLADLWLARELVSQVAIYGSKAAEGFAAFQHRSFLNNPPDQILS